MAWIVGRTIVMAGKTIGGVAATPVRTAVAKKVSAKTSETASRKVARIPARTTKAKELSKIRDGRKYSNRCITPICQYACADAGAGGF